MAWFNPGRWLAVILFIALIYIGHNLDKRQAVKKAVAAVHAEHTALALAASEANRAKEKALMASAEKVRSDYAKQKALNASLVRANADRLREYQAASAAVDRPASGDTSTTSGVDNPYRLVANQCAAALVVLDEHAQGLRAKASALQEFANSVRIK